MFWRSHSLRLSYAISTLEEELGVKLFEKNGRNVSLTKYGKSFSEGRGRNTEPSGLLCERSEAAGKGEGCIDVAFLRTLGVDFMPKIISRFLAANPTENRFILICSVTKF